MDIYDEADWTEMDIEDLKAAIESGASIQEAADLLCRADGVEEVARKMRGAGSQAEASIMKGPADQQLILAAIRRSACSPATSSRNRATPRAPWRSYWTRWHAPGSSPPCSGSEPATACGC